LILETLLQASEAARAVVEEVEEVEEEEVSVLVAPEAAGAHLRVTDDRPVKISTPIDLGPIRGPDRPLRAVIAVAQSHTDLDLDHLQDAEVDEEIAETVLVITVSDVAVPATTVIVGVALLAVQKDLRGNLRGRIQSWTKVESNNRFI
jgi:hypothetical protein